MATIVPQSICEVRKVECMNDTGFKTTRVLQLGRKSSLEKRVEARKEKLEAEQE
jgi:hypothetical protein